MTAPSNAYSISYSAAPGSVASSKSSKSNPGETTQETSASSAEGTVRCHTPAGTTACGTWPAATSTPTSTVSPSTGAEPAPPNCSDTTPVCASQISSEVTRCHADDSPARSRK